MSESDLYFDDHEAFIGFTRELRAFFPDACTGGNSCSRIGLLTLEIATKVDRGEVSEAEAKNLAAEEADGLRCRRGLINPNTFAGNSCGRNVVSRF
jgi:hypothetical protein